jgi:hypothetical protein
MLVTAVYQEHLVLQAQRDQQVLMELTVNQVYQDLQDLQERLVLQDRQVLTEQLV